MDLGAFKLKPNQFLQTINKRLKELHTLGDENIPWPDDYSVSMILISPFVIEDQELSRQRLDFHDLLRYQGLSEDEMEERKADGESITSTLNILNVKVGM